MPELTPHKLMDGIDHKGKRHLIFAVRIPVMRDIYDALDETEEACGSTETKGADLYYRMALTKRALTQLGDISLEDITTDFLLDNLTSLDYDEIDSAIDDAKKKRRAENNDETASEPSS